MATDLRILGPESAPWCGSRAIITKLSRGVGRLARISILPLFVASALVLTGCFRGADQDMARSPKGIPLPARSNPPLPTEYAVVAHYLCDDIFATPDEADRKRSHAELMALLQQMVLDLDQLASTDSDLTLVAKKSAACARTASDLLAEAAAMPSPPDSLQEFATSFVQGYMGDYISPLLRSRELFQYAGRSREILQALQAEVTKAETLQLLLPAIAKKYAGPLVAAQTVLTVDFDEALIDGQSDCLTLVNQSGHTLHNCTIEVALIGRGGQTRKNIHFSGEWTPGQTLYAHYSGGPSSTDELGFTRNSVVGVVSLEVSLYSDEVSSRLSYRYEGAEKDKDIERFLAPVAISVHYRPFAKGLFWNDQRAAVCSLAGAEMLPRGSLTVVFKRRGQSQMETLRFDRWEKDAVQTVEFSSIAWEPTAWTCQLKLEGSESMRAFTGEFARETTSAP